MSALKLVWPQARRLALLHEGSGPGEEVEVDCEAQVELAEGENVGVLHGAQAAIVTDDQGVGLAMRAREPQEGALVWGPWRALPVYPAVVALQREGLVGDQYATAEVDLARLWGELRASPEVWGLCWDAALEGAAPE